MARVNSKGINSKKEKGRETEKKENFPVVSWAEERQGLPDECLLQCCRLSPSRYLSHRDCIILVRTCSGIPELIPA